MRYSNEEKARLLDRLQELLNESDPSIQAVLVTNTCVYTCSDRSNMPSVYDLMDSVAEEFGIDEGDLGGFSVLNIQALRKLGGCFYAERL